MMDAINDKAAINRAVHIPQDVIQNYMSNSISNQELTITRTLATALVTLGDRADAMLQKVAFLEAQVADMKIVLHASLLAAENKLPEVPKINLMSSSSDGVRSKDGSPKRRESFGFSPDMLAEQPPPPRTNNINNNNNNNDNNTPYSDTAMDSTSTPSSPTNNPSAFNLVNKKRSSTSDFQQLMEKLGTADELNTRL